MSGRPITSNYKRILVYIANNPGRTRKQIQVDLNISKSNVAANIAKMLEKHIIQGVSNGTYNVKYYPYTLDKDNKAFIERHAESEVPQVPVHNPEAEELEEREALNKNYDTPKTSLNTEQMKKKVLTLLSPRELMAELYRRGYDGELTLTQTVKLSNSIR